MAFKFFAHRYEAGSVIITSNQPFSAWDRVFPDDMMAVAAIDRLIHHAPVIELSGESYREKTHMQQLQEVTHKPRHRHESSITDRPE